ncbi:MAG TPA: branched-chain amino acid ABC transporter substrate-binding protein [Clostridia bacterium]|nr:branched-chain amino acid ABC transporter substrate-binding protein [Clostridia bacterium]
MKKIAKILIAIIVMSLLLTGCGGNASKTVKIAYIGPITGPNAAIGIGMKNSAQLAIDQANKSGKLPYKLELVVLDDVSDPAQAVNAVNKAASDPDIVAAVAHFNSGCALATVHTFNKYQLPAVIIGAIHDQITENGYPEITRVISAASIQNKVAGDVAVKEFGVKRISVIHDQTDYGKTNADQFIAQAKANGAEILSYDGISVGQQDFSAVLTAIKSKNPEMVFFGGLATEAALIKRQMKELNINALFMSDSGILSTTFNEIAADAAEGAIAHGIGKPIEDLPGGQAYIEAYKNAGFKEPYEAYGPFAYDATNIVIDALSRVEKPDRASLTKAIRETKNFPGILGETSFDEKGQTTLDLITTYISENGEWVPYYKSKIKVVDKQIKK